jgi:glycosyltransferase involved in cell wall biosynthesis
MNNFLSVCIPNYRRSQELSRCLDSILRQTIYPSEVLIHDDCSPNQLEIEAVINTYKELFLIKKIPFKTSNIFI